MLIHNILKARSLQIHWVTHNAQFFKDRPPLFQPNFDEQTLFEVVDWNWRGECLIVRCYDGADGNNPKPQVVWLWVNSRYLEDNKL